MSKMDSYANFASLPFLVTLSIPPICILIYHFILFPLFRSDLRSIPGPALAKLTDVYRLLLVRTGAAHEHHIRLHERYGPFVRLGPNTVSVGSPAAIPVIYNTRTRHPKSAFYPVMGNVAHGKVVPTIFSTRDESVHEIMKRPIAQVYAMTNLKTYEPLVESTESLFFSKLERLADEGASFDLGTWLHWFATDVIMEITFGKRLGFLQREEDVDAILETIEQRFCERKKERRDHPEKTGHKRDFLARFLDIQASNSNIPDFWIISWCQQNVQAGSDSTAITLTSVIYYLLKNPDSMEELLAELDHAKLPSPIPWDIAHKLPYLDSCIKEALRMTPAIGIPLERVTPAQGLELEGHNFQAGTVLGVNAWVVHRDQMVYGTDSTHWRPGRWIEADQDQKKMMERTLFAFGGGSRVCLGKNISYLEMYKVIPELLTRFRFELTTPQKDWSVKNGFFTYTKGVEVRIQRQESLGRY
ncbi:pisatin demethylase [Penicillium capsulatum]|uniref:Pisatin demethylase n=1 Tax=Penicillium capsulatum TaxID=69766 RepID=A0A9W9IJG1_9EURO|nr:pisatin demethylase [Penicillium capsulatum]